MPAFLEGRCTPETYSKWLRVKADYLLERDKKRHKPYAAAATQRTYAEKIHQAVAENGMCDPYTGDRLAWELIGSWDTSHEQPEGYKRKFALMPTVDHKTPDALDFEICAWITNECKTDLGPEEFVEFCRKVVNYRSPARDRRPLA
jgi:hypothetical protein